jgi:anti-anti-sigma factor
VGTDDPAMLTADISDEAGTTVVALDGELEYATAASLRATFSDLARKPSGPVVVDLSALRFVDSIGLSLLVQARERFAAEGVPFALRNPAANVARVLETSGLTELFALDADDH